MPATVVEVNPFISRNVVLTFGGVDGDDFAKAVSSAVLTPAGGTANFKGSKPDAVFSFPQAATWTLDLEYAQDWGTADSLSVYLFQHQGENVSVSYNANDVTTGGETVWTMTVSITAGAVGGAVDAVATATVSLGVVGAPVPTFPA